MKYFNNNKYGIATATILFGVVFIGLLVRVKGLGVWGIFSSDEYYMLRSAQNIISRGLPKYELGGYYNRGLIYQYLSVLLIKAGVKDVLAVRLISVFFNIIAMPIIYLIGKKTAGRFVAVLAVILFSFSIIEIEYSRIARFYTAYQTFFIVYIYFLYKIVVEKDSSYYRWLYFSSFFCIFIYAGGIFLAALNFLPFLITKNNINKTHLSISAIILLFCFLYLKVDFTIIGVVNNSFPSEIDMGGIAKSKGMIYLPKLLITTIYKNIIWVVPFLIMLFITGYFSVIVFKRNYYNFFIKLTIITLYVLLLINLFSLTVYIILAMLLCRLIVVEDLSRKEFKYLFIIMLSSFVYWLCYCYYIDTWFQFFPNLYLFSLKKVIVLFFGYPDIYNQVVYPWFNSLPITVLFSTSIILIYTVIYFVSDYDNEEYDSYRFILLILLLMVLAVSITVTPYQLERYTFFIYPLFILISLISLKNIAYHVLKNKYINVVLFSYTVIFVLFSKDYNLYHIYNIDSHGIHFKMGYSKELVRLYYFREDYEMASQAINKNLESGDIVISTLAPMEYYLDKLNYFYLDYNNVEFSRRSRLNGTKELWTNACLIYRSVDLYEIINKRSSTIWFATYSEDSLHIGELEKEFNKKYSKYKFYTTLNYTINIYKITDRNVVNVNTQTLN
jgi:hypothetical protein